jgi:simple sugar transport system ATP-binding protein
LTIAYNAILGNLAAFTRAGFLNQRRIKNQAHSLVRRYKVRTPGITFEAGKLSGGNLQKVVLGREVMRQPRLLIAEQPTRGLDVGATEYVQQQLLAERDRGAAVLLISVELEEIMALSDRIAVIYQGEIMGIVEPGQVELETIGLMMAGTRQDELYA